MRRVTFLIVPYLSAWEGLVATLAMEDIGQANRVAMLQLVEHTSWWDRPRLLLAVRSCRSKTMYDQTQTRVVIALRGEMGSSPHDPGRQVAIQRVRSGAGVWPGPPRREAVGSIFSGRP